MSLRFVVDMNLPPTWGSFLTAAGFEATHWRTIGSPDASDETIVQWAIDQNAAILTLDLDYARIVALSRRQRPSIVLLRTGETLLHDVGSHVVGAIRGHQQRLLEGAILSVYPHNVRIHTLPIR